MCRAVIAIIAFSVVISQGTPALPNLSRFAEGGDTTDLLAALRDFMEASEQRVSSVESKVDGIESTVSVLSTKVADVESKLIRCESGEDTSPAITTWEYVHNTITFAKSFHEPPTVIIAPRKVVDDQAMMGIWSNIYYENVHKNQFDIKYFLYVNESKHYPHSYAKMWWMACGY